VIHLGGEAAVVVPVSAPAATVINAACSCLAMAVQVLQEAPGGGNGAGSAVDGRGGGAGRGSLHAGHDRDGVGDQVVSAASSLATIARAYPAVARKRGPGVLATRISS
jgi:hypothetical protein